MPLDALPYTLRPPYPGDLETALRAVVPDLPSLCVSVTFVLFDSATEQMSAYAIMEGGDCSRFAGTELHVSGWLVSLITEDSPVSRAVCCPPARLGDCVTVQLSSDGPTKRYLAQIVSWNGSPLLTDAERNGGCQAQIARSVAASSEATEKRKQTARRDKEDGIIADLRARRIAKETAWRSAAGT